MLFRSGATPNFASAVYSSVDIGGGWFRQIGVVTLNANGSVQFIVDTGTDGASSQFSIWGAKLEPGSTATPYVPISALPKPAWQATTASKPLIQRVSNRYVMSFDGSNDSLTCGLASGGSPFVRSYTTTGTVSGFTSATTTTFVMGQPTLASRNVCMIVGAPNTIPAADLLVIERFAQSVGAAL